MDSDRRDSPRPLTWPRGTEALRYGGDYNPEQWPRETWHEDVRLMREAGVNLVSIGIFSWSVLEPSEGVYDFALLDEVMDLLHANGIDVDLGTPTAAPPAWFWARYPDSRPVTRSGTALGFGSRGMVSPSSPEYRRAATEIARRLAERYRDHPSLVMWHVHNEYGAPISDCYSDHSVRAFRAWLEARYGSLDELNRAWGTSFWGQRYGTWDEIDAPRQSASTTNQTQRLDFARFTSDALLACFTAERDAIREHTPHLPITTNFMASSCPSIDYWRWSREVDVVANDHYLTAERRDSHVMLALDADLTRSFAGNRPWMLMEHSTSAVNWQPRNIAKRPGEMARNSLAHVARGSDAVMFFQFRASRFGAEKFHSAMLPHGGTDTRIWREVVALGADVAALAPVRGSRVRARVAILWDIQSSWAQDLEWRPSVELDHRERVEAFYTALWHRGVTVDFAHPHHDLSGYDVVLAPAQYLLDEEGSRNLRDFVAGGGRLVVSYFSGIVDQDDAVHEGMAPGALRDVLGLGVQEFIPLRADETVALDSGATGTGWADDIVLCGAEALVRYASGPAADGPAITRNAVGSGAAWYVSTRLDPAALDALLADVLAQAGIDAEPAPDGLERVTRHGDGEAFTFLVNHADDPRTVAIRGAELLTGTEADGALEVPAGAVRVVRTAG
ncbi:beta-galactosidase [Clavibacter sepedonicus]|uniref:beta-galactosidase n=1 Tax=Clavibacter sepedonicus TaxID=31964 RepID=UPI003DA1F614